MSAPLEIAPRCAASAHSAEASRPGHFPDLARSGPERNCVKDQVSPRTWLCGVTGTESVAPCIGCPEHSGNLSAFAFVASRAEHVTVALSVTATGTRGTIIRRRRGDGRPGRLFRFVAFGKTEAEAHARAVAQIKRLFPSQQWDVALAPVESKGFDQAGAKCGIRQPAPGARSLSEARGLSGDNG